MATQEIVHNITCSETREQKHWNIAFSGVHSLFLDTEPFQVLREWFLSLAYRMRDVYYNPSTQKEKKTLLH